MKSIKRFLLPLFSAVGGWLDQVNYGERLAVAALLVVAMLFGVIEPATATMAGAVLAAHTAVAFFSDGSGTTYSISASLPASYDATGYGTTTGIAWTLIGKPKTFPQFGSKRNVQEWRPISGGVEKGKGSPNYGGGQATFGDVPADAGQVILKAAEASANHYSMKLTFPDGEIHYLDVLVCSWELSSAADGSPMERLCDIQLCRAPVVVAAA